MSNDADLIADIDRAFGGCEKPEHFGNYTHCEECAEHDQLLRIRTRETLTIEDVGNVGWDPICFSDGPGIAYYFPALARLAISPPTYQYGWYGDQLLFHLTTGEADNQFLRFCSVYQRRVVGQLLEYLQKQSKHLLAQQEQVLSTEDEFARARSLWSEP